MKITLRIEGADKTFTQDFVSGRMFRKTLEKQKLLQKDIDETTLDSMVDYVVELYGGQFTRDQFYDGIRAQEMMPTITGAIDGVVNGASEAIGADPSDPNSR
jgi:hypothetical protein